MQKNVALIGAGTLFFLAALVHLYRLIHPFNLVINDYPVPLWANGIAFIAFGFLSLWMFRSLRS